ncbi:MAG: HAD-IC family P-type ATPase [Ktedonobacteraceae bacterium]|nr:HAD-IC family P-type ATPase [Ktedonobacteraceae bacterium]
MRDTIAEKSEVLHVIPGRIRIHVAGWSAQEKRGLERQLSQVPGISRVQANPLTGNILIHFDPAVTDEQAILQAIDTLDFSTLSEPETGIVPPPPAIHEKHGGIIRARIAVRGLDRDPHLAGRIVERLERRSGVHARASALTGRILVEFEEEQANLDDVIAEIAGLELPPLPDEDRPDYPLDPAPLLQSAARTIGAGLGIGFFAIRRLLGLREPLPGANVAFNIASIISILQGIPPIRSGLRKLLGRTATDLLFSLPGIATLTLAESPLGLTVSGAEALRLFTEVKARQDAWRRHEELVSSAPSAQPDAIIRLESGERAPLAAQVLEGTGTASGRDGMPLPVTPGSIVPPGAQLHGSSFLLKLQAEHSFQPFTPESRPELVTSSLYHHYHRIISFCSLAYAGLTALLTRSFSQTLAAMLLVSPRPAIVGQEHADLAAAARVIRAGVTIVGTRPQRRVRLPSLLLLDGMRLLTDQLELAEVIPLARGGELTTNELQARAAGVAAAAGFPWGRVFKDSSALPATEGTFDGKTATALSQGVRYTLGPIEDWSQLPEAAHLRLAVNYLLVLRSEQEQAPLGLLVLRPRLAAGVEDLVRVCQRHHVELAVLAGGDQLAARALARRTQIAPVENDDALQVIRARQQEGKTVFFVSDNASASAAFSTCDLAIGLTDNRSHLPARADLLAPDLIAIAAIIEAGARRENVARDSVGLSLLSNIVGVLWGIRGMPALRAASRVLSISTLAVLVDGWLRLRGGHRMLPTTALFTDPRPERWGEQSVEEVLRALDTTEYGLTDVQAAERCEKVPSHAHRNQVFATLLEQLRSPLIGMLAVGAGFSLLLGSVGDVLIIGATIVLSVAISTWQEQRANRVAETLERMGAPHARVLRNNQPITLPAPAIVPGDVLLLAPGDRIAADARIISAQNLEVDESTLTGESLPVAKATGGKTAANHIVLEGTDVTSGSGQAVVIAVGQHTRMGATRAALAGDEDVTGSLGTRLSSMLRVLIPLSVASGVLVIATGLFWGQPLTTLLALGTTVALAAVPEGLPLLAKVGEAGVARRLTRYQAVVRRLSSIEALGRVDVACADKTGTMTRGRLQLSMVANIDHEALLNGELPAELRHVLLAAAFASPSPDAPDAASHPTDMAIIQGAIDAGMEEQIRVRHEAELPFDPTRAFHASVVQGILYLKGAPEALLPRCQWVCRHGEKQPLNETMRSELLQHSLQFAGRGLRMLMVAEGDATAPLDDPQQLCVLGFVGISDPLRSTVQAAVNRCHDAGVRVIMITGDHPSTARAIAQEAGLLDEEGEVLTASEIAELQNSDLDRRLKRAVIIARATPLDKLRIIESLQRQGHTVAMTGDGVNDAPALRLADVGIAMGRGSTEVARQTADVVITDDDFSTLVETFVEGRSFWRNIRRALGLLLGGNLGELGLIVGASLLGSGIPLTARQILALNAITDIFPALAVALQQPEHRNLADLRREGISALGTPLRNELLRRALTTSLPSLAAYLLTLRQGGQFAARSVAFASIITTQLAQTLDMGRSEGHFTSSVSAAVAGSLAVLAATFALPPLRQFLGLVIPSPAGWLLIAGATVISLFSSRLLAAHLSPKRRTSALSQKHNQLITST